MSKYITNISMVLNDTTSVIWRWKIQKTDECILIGREGKVFIFIEI